MEHVLITGANGELGCQAVSELIDNKFMVTAISRDETRLCTSQKRDEMLMTVSCDLINTEKVCNVVKKIKPVNTLIHLSNGPPANNSDHVSCTNQVIMTLNLIEFFGKQLRHTIVGSCVTVYGGQSTRRLRENHPTYPTTYHGSSLLAAEQFWNLFAANTGKPVTFLRFATFQAANIDDGSEKTHRVNPKFEKNRDAISVYTQEIMSCLRAKKAGVFNLYPNF